MSYLALRAMAKSILEHATDFPWRYQGLGMLQMDLDDGHRLHVWNPGLRTPGASQIHDHLQWDFESTVLVGTLYNFRYVRDDQGGHYFEGCVNTDSATLCEKGRIVHLRRHPVEVHKPGSKYEQKAHEIHETDAQGGTVSIIRRFRTGTPMANVFWRTDEQWGTATRRPATGREIKRTAAFALARFQEAL